MNALASIPGSNSLLELPRMLLDPVRFLRERAERWGNIWRTRWIVPIVVVVGPEANQRVFVTARDRFSYEGGYGDLAIGKIFAGSLIVKDGEPHRHDRDILQPAVGRLGLSQSLDRVLAIWGRGAERVKGKDVDCYEFARDVTFEVSANALVDLELTESPGSSPGSSPSGLAEWRSLFEELIGGATANTTWRIPFGALDRGLKARDKVIAKLAPRIDEARRREPRGMVGLLAHHKEPDGSALSTEEIAAHVLLLFWAGYDTTASTGGWVLHQLADHPEWQERLRAEAARVLEGGREMRVEDQEKLVEHTWFLKEIERVNPTVIFFPRKTVDDVEVLGKMIPKGTVVMWSPYLSHVMGWDHPDAFEPERWQDAQQSGKNIAPHSLVGFGGGPRICLGKAFASLQLRVLIVTMLRRYRIERVQPGTAMAIPTHRPLGSVIRLVPR